MKFWEKFKIALIVESRDGYKKAILSLLEKDKNAKLLDLGCGDSRGLTNKIVDKIGAAEVHGVDLHWGSPNPSMRIHQSDLNREFPLGNEHFDVVVASQIIEHLWNTDGFLKEIYRALKPTGYAIVSTPNLAAWHNVLYLILGKQPETAKVSDEMYPENEKLGHKRVFTASELTKLLRFHGFKIEKVVGSSYHPLTGWLARLMCRLDKWHASIVTVKVKGGIVEAKDWIIRAYTQDADTYDCSRFEDPNSPSTLRLKRKIEEVTSKYLTGNSTIFEIAAGTGYWGRFFLGKGFKFSGVDITPAMVKKAEEKGIYTIKVGDIEDIGVYPKGVDNIVCIKAFTMFQRPLDVLYNVKESLRPGGRFIVFYNNKWDIPSLIFSLFVGKKKASGNPGPYDKFISRGKVLRMLEEVGLKVVKVGGCCSLPFRFLPRWKWLDRVDDHLSCGWIIYIVAEREDER